jgi:hypothetical protein
MPNDQPNLTEALGIVEIRSETNENTSEFFRTFPQFSALLLHSFCLTLYGKGGYREYRRDAPGG